MTTHQRTTHQNTPAAVLSLPVPAEPPTEPADRTAGGWLTDDDMPVMQRAAETGRRVRAWTATLASRQASERHAQALSEFGTAAAAVLDELYTAHDADGQLEEATVYALSMLLLTPHEETLISPTTGAQVRMTAHINVSARGRLALAAISSIVSATVPGMLNGTMEVAALLDMLDEALEHGGA
ncbi:hypothetical protein ACFVUY_38165 [Kitasatospora sp. NPDC058063]|uniref:hypothetical protein n=1 Tax=unclassified Kitasatospora TaxID=2633591 RepID=UPI0036DC52B3